MRYVCLLLLALLAGCGGSEDVRVVAAFIATPGVPFIKVVARQKEKEKEMEPVTLAPADAFHATVSGVIDTPGNDQAEPIAVNSAPASTPEDSEPVPL